MKIRITDKQADKSAAAVNTLGARLNALRNAGRYDDRDLTTLCEKHSTASNELTSRRNKTREPLDAALAAVNGRAESFTVTSYSHLDYLSKRAEKLLEERGVRTKNRVGAVLEYRPAGPSANAYKYDAISTGVEITRFSTGWFLTDCSRESVYPREREVFTIALGEKAIDDIVAYAMTGFTSR